MSDMESVRVHISGSDVPLAAPGPKNRPSSFTTHVLPITAAVESLRILAHAPNRARAVITCVGQSTDTAYFSGSKSDAQSLSGSIVMGLQVVVLLGTDEVWVSAPIGKSMAFGVVAEYVTQP